MGISCFHQQERTCLQPPRTPRSRAGIDDSAPAAVVAATPRGGRRYFRQPATEFEHKRSCQHCPASAAAVQQPTSCGLLCERHVHHASAVMAAEANFSRKLSHCVMCTHAWGAVTDQIRRVRSASRDLRISKHEELYARVLPLHNGRVSAAKFGFAAGPHQTPAASQHHATLCRVGLLELIHTAAAPVRPDVITRNRPPRESQHPRSAVEKKLKATASARRSTATPAAGTPPRNWGSESAIELELNSISVRSLPREGARRTCVAPPHVAIPSGFSAHVSRECGKPRASG